MDQSIAEQDGQPDEGKRCADADGAETKIFHRNKEIWSETLEFQGSADAILSLRAFCGEDISGESITISADVNSDNLIGLAEAIFVIQTVARLR